jgi:hypothetical protein
VSISSTPQLTGFSSLGSPSSQWNTYKRLKTKRGKLSMDAGISSTTGYCDIDSLSRPRLMTIPVSRRPSISNLLQPNTLLLKSMLQQISGLPFHTSDRAPRRTPERRLSRLHRSLMTAGPVMGRSGSATVITWSYNCIPLRAESTPFGCRSPHCRGNPSDPRRLKYS